MAGLSLDKAEKKLRHAGCRVGRVLRRTSTLLGENHVLGQNPARGRRKPAGTKVLLVVGQGPKTGRLPTLDQVVPSQLPPFIAYDPPAGGIWLVKPDGSDAHQVGPPDATGPVWSPDATRILYTAPAPQNSQGVSMDLYVMNADGTDQHPVMPADGGVPPSNWRDSDFHWSPDGKEIVFTRQYELGNDLEIANADGSDAHSVGVAVDTPFSAAFSPDGSYLAFDVYPEHVLSVQSAWGIYVAKPDGTGLRQLTFGGDVGDPSWSPDGTRIIYGCLGSNAYALAQGANGICELSGNPARQRILYMNRAESLEPTWNANGTKILLTVENGANGPEQLALMSPSGGPPMKIGVLLASRTYPDW
jgi:Tol biopolymer transport system component